MNTQEAAQEFVASDVQKRTFKVRLESTDRLLMNALTKDQIMAMINAPKTKKGAAILEEPASDLSQEEIAAAQIYRDHQGRICLPAQNIYSALRQAGTDIHWGPKSNKTMVTRKSGRDKGQTMIFSFLRIKQAHLPLLDLMEGGINEEGWTVDVRRGRKFARAKANRNVRIIRPLFPRWAVEFELEVSYIDPAVTEKLIKDLFHLAGREIGVGAFRPGLSKNPETKKFCFGTFYLKTFEEINN